jgi:hypothetical protein
MPQPATASVHDGERGTPARLTVDADRHHQDLAVTPDETIIQALTQHVDELTAELTTLWARRDQVQPGSVADRYLAHQLDHVRTALEAAQAELWQARQQLATGGLSPAPAS